MSRTLYVYTIRNSRKSINGFDKPSPQFVELIPKLFTELDENTGEREIKSYVSKLHSDNQDQDIHDIDSMKRFFAKLLDTKDTLLDKTEYLTHSDVDWIKELNLDLVSNIQVNMFDKFLQHLARGHETMRYGIYFSIKYAENAQDFIKKMGTQTDNPTNDQEIIFFTPLNTLLKHLDQVIKTKMSSDEDFRFYGPLLYISDGWQYGKIDKDSIVMNKKVDGTPDILLFESMVRKKYSNNNKIIDPELICQIPLPNELFMFFFQSVYQNQYQDGGSIEKYLDSKKEYLNLIKNNI